MQIRTLSLLAALTLGLPACSSTSSVDLSSRDRHVAVADVNRQEVLDVEAAAIAAVRGVHPAQGNAAFWLLTGSDYQAYQGVAGRMAPGYATPDQTAGAPLYAVRSLKMSGATAEAVVACPGKEKPFALAKVKLEKSKGAWSASGVTDLPPEFNTLAELLAAEGRPEPKNYNWAQRNLLGKKTPEQLAARKAEKEAEAKAEQEKAAAEAAQPKQYNWLERNLLGRKTDEQKAADQAKEAEEASKPKRSNWIQRNIQGRRTPEEQAEEAAAQEAKAKLKMEKDAADKAAADAKAAEEAAQPKQYNWIERNILGRKTEAQKAAEVAQQEAKAKAKAEKEAAEKPAETR